MIWKFALAVAILAPSACRAEPAARASDFLDSIGFGTHFGYLDTPYGTAYDGVKWRLADLGVHHLRDGLDNKHHEDRLKEMARAGVGFCVVAEPDAGTPEKIRDRVKAINADVPGAIDVIEGPNEPDFFWVSNKKSYGGKSGADGPQAAVDAAVLFQKDLYRAFKADPATAAIHVMGIALGKTYGPGTNPIPAGELAGFVDWGNFHPYFGGNPFSIPYAYGGLEKFYWQGTHPGTNIGEFPYATKTYSPPYAPKPMATSEAGCSTDTNGTSETAHGKYIPRMFLEYFRIGIARTYSYELVDEFPDPKNREARFGILRRDLSPKPAFTSLKNLFAALADPHAGPDFKPVDLDFKLDVSPVDDWKKVELVHHLLLQKSDGEYDLVVWHEVSCEDGSTKPRRQFTPPPMPCRLTVDRGKYSISATQWDDRGEPQPLAIEATPWGMNFAATDNLTLVRLRPVKP